jgi:hypothetical protein
MINILLFIVINGGISYIEFKENGKGDMLFIYYLYLCGSKCSSSDTYNTK